MSTRSSAVHYLIPILLSAGVILLAASAFRTGIAVQPASGAVSQGGTYSNPFTYCAAVRTVDRPDARYTGTVAPETVAASMQDMLSMANASTTGTQPSPVFIQSSLWRCMNGKVYACAQGEDVVCGQKADTGRAASQAMKDFCTSNPSNEMIPVSVTGRTTVYEWRCTDGSPTIIRQFVNPDARGYLSQYWAEVNP